MARRKVDLKRALKKLVGVAKMYAVDVKAVRDEGADEGLVSYYDPDTRSIGLDYDLRHDPVLLVYCLAHEIGHVIELDCVDEKEFTQRMKLAQRFNRALRTRGRIPKATCDRIVRFESEATECGEWLMEQLGIVFPKRVHKTYHKRLLDGYQSLFVELSKGKACSR